MVNMDFIDKVAWIPLFNNRVLFTRSKGAEFFYNAGGKREPGETDQETLIREVMEELNVSIFPATIKHMHTFEGVVEIKPNRPRIRVACYDAAYAGDLKPSNEVEELAWFGLGDGGRTTDMGRRILAWLFEGRLISS
jgi:8-oxo-dGTP diphosphatase